MLCINVALVQLLWDVSMDILSLRRGRAPNCSSGGSVIGLALLSASAASSVLAFWAQRLMVHRSNSTDSEPPNLRPEEFGSIVQLENPPGRVFIGNSTTFPLTEHLSSPTEVHLNLTKRCPVQCSNCYLDAGPSGEHASLEAVKEDLQQLKESGVFEVALGGGEVLLSPHWREIAAHAKEAGLIVNLTCSGFGVTSRNAQEIARTFGQINLSLDGLGEDYQRSRGWNGANVGLRALRLLRQAGARVGVNTVLTKPLFPDGLRRLGELLLSEGISDWQWLRLKPQSRAQEGYLEQRLTAAQRAELWPLTLEFERNGLTIRWDCAMVPFLAHHAEDQAVNGITAARARQLGVVGCVGGERLLARGVDGTLSPCSFVSGQRHFQSISEHWQEDSTLNQWRNLAKDPPEPCLSCSFQSVCRSGCRVVSAHLTGQALNPDPECSRVIEWQASQP